MSNILQDMMGLLSRKKQVTPKTDDFITIARYANSQERMKPNPKVQTELVTVLGLKTLINEGGGSGDFLPLAGGTMSGDIVLDTNLIQGLQIHTIGTNNTGLGIDALSSIEEGSFNVAVGDSALLKTDDGSRNVGIGVNALLNNTEGDYNIAIGFSSLSTNVTTSNNTAVGYKTLADNIADGISAFGSTTLASNTTGTFNNAFGFGALNKNITGDSNNAFGNSALLNNLTGRFNSAFGNHALKDNTAHENSAFGSSALTLSTTGRYNTAVGRNSLSSNTTGGYSTGVGRNSLLNSTGAENTAIGESSLSGVTTGTGNIGVGGSSGASIGTGTDCIVIGYGADVVLANASRQLNIGSWIYGSNGEIGIGITAPAAQLDVAGGVKVANDTDTASAAKVGTIRYRDTASNSYTEICMKTGAATYAWHVLATYSY